MDEIVFYCFNNIEPKILRFQKGGIRFYPENLFLISQNPRDTHEYLNDQCLYLITFFDIFRE